MQVRILPAQFGITMKQYAIIKDNKYLTSMYKWTTSLGKAELFSKKYSADIKAKMRGGPDAEVVRVYISLEPPRYHAESVWVVEKVCQVRGLTVYGPFFNKKEAEEIFVSLRDAVTSEVEDWQSLFSFTDHGWGYATNKLHDTLTIRETRRCVDT